VTAPHSSSTAAAPDGVETFRGRIVTDTSRALLFFTATPEETLVGLAAWIPSARIATIKHDGCFGHGAPAEVTVRGPVTWAKARLVGSDQVQWIDGPPARPLEKRIPPNPIAPWPRHSRPAPPVAISHEPSLSEALATATIERVGPTVEELLAKHARRGVVIGRSESGWSVRAAVGETDEGYVRTTVPLEGATLLEALEALDAAAREHAFARARHKSRITGGRR
jgi:hypothetical protein